MPRGYVVGSRVVLFRVVEQQFSHQPSLRLFCSPGEQRLTRRFVFDAPWRRQRGQAPPSSHPLSLPELRIIFQIVLAILMPCSQCCVGVRCEAAGSLCAFLPSIIVCPYDTQVCSAAGDSAWHRCFFRGAYSTRLSAETWAALFRLRVPGSWHSTFCCLYREQAPSMDFSSSSWWDNPACRTVESRSARTWCWVVCLILAPLPLRAWLPLLLPSGVLMLIWYEKKLLALTPPRSPPPPCCLLPGGTLFAQLVGNL